MAINLFDLSKEERDRVEAYFWERVEKKGKNECWMWKGQLGGGASGALKHRYGDMSLGHSGKLYRSSPHRYSWMLKYNIPIPNGLWCCHSCDVKLCVNPNHIFLATREQNYKDALLKDRFCKIKLADRVKVAQKVQEGYSAKLMAHQYGVSDTCVLDILKRPEIQQTVGKIDLSDRDVTYYRKAPQYCLFKSK